MTFLALHVYFSKSKSPKNLRLSTLGYRLFTHVVQSFKAARGGDGHGADCYPNPGRAEALRYMLDHNPINVVQSFKAALCGITGMGQG